MKKYDQLTNDIIANIGGKDNVISVTHCVTRLRFQLKDETLANDEALKNNEGIITIMHSAGQYQIVIGNHVPDVYDEVAEKLNLSPDVKAEKKKMTFKEKAVDLITGIFMPSIAMLCACGMIKGLNTILNFAGLYGMDSGIYMLFNAIGDSVFYFFPVIIGYNTSKKLGGTPYIGMVIGAAMCYPSITDVELLIFGKVICTSYTGTVLPVILTVAAAVPFEKWLNKKLPDVIKSFITPMLVLLICTSFGFCIIGPVANAMSGVISDVILGAYNISPVLGGFLFAGLWQVFIIFGFHITFIVLCIMNLGAGIPDPLLGAQVFCAFAQTAVVLVVFLKTRQKKLKDICAPAIISGIFGVTEPAIYGITLPRINLFVISCIGSALSGAYCGMVGLKYQQMAGMGIFEIPALFPAEGVGEVLVQSLIASAIAVSVSFVLAWIVYKEDDKEESVPKEEKTVNAKNEIIVSPLIGEAKKLSEVKDDAFASGMLGKGVAIIPTEGKVYAPFDGTVVTLFPTKHAIGLISEEGCNLLIHVGMDTVNLNGKYFTSHVEQGDTVRKGQLLVEFEIEKLKEEGFVLDTPVLITNMDDYSDIIVEESGPVDNDKKLLYVIH